MKKSTKKPFSKNNNFNKGQNQNRVQGQGFNKGQTFTPIEPEKGEHIFDLLSEDVVLSKAGFLKKLNEHTEITHKKYTDYFDIYSNHLGKPDFISMYSIPEAVETKYPVFLVMGKTLQSEFIYLKYIVKLNQFETIDFNKHSLKEYKETMDDNFTYHQKRMLNY